MSVAGCPRCGNERHRGRCKTASKKPELKPEQTSAPAADSDGTRLSIAPGLGVEAWLENGCLQLSQGDDVVALSPTEWKVVVAQFEEWAA